MTPHPLNDENALAGRKLIVSFRTRDRRYCLFKVLGQPVYELRPFVEEEGRFHEPWVVGTAEEVVKVGKLLVSSRPPLPEAEPAAQAHAHDAP